MNDYDGFLDDLGERLTAAASSHGVARARRRRRAAVVGLAAAAAAAIAIGAIAVVPGGNGLDAVARADDALAPNGQIIHMRLVSTVVGGHVAKNLPRSQTTEL